MRHAKPAKEGRRETPGVSRMQGRPAEAIIDALLGTSGYRRIAGRSTSFLSARQSASRSASWFRAWRPALEARSCSWPFSVLGNGYCVRTGRTAGEAITAVRVEGSDLCYEEKGEGVPILLIHAGGATASTWGRAVDDLA